MATLSKEERPVVGKLINEAKKSVEELLAALLVKVENAEMTFADVGRFMSLSQADMVVGGDDPKAGAGPTPTTPDGTATT